MNRLTIASSALAVVFASCATPYVEPPPQGYYRQEVRDSEYYRPQPPSTPPPPVETQHYETQEEKETRIAIQLGAALAVKLGCANTKCEDIFEALALEAVDSAADYVIQKSIEEALPDVDPLARRQLVYALCAAAEDDLTLKSLAIRNGKDEVKGYLDSVDPDLGTSAEVVDFMASAFGRVN